MSDKRMHVRMHKRAHEWAYKRANAPKFAPDVAALLLFRREASK